MKIGLITVGKPTDPHYHALCEEYVRRIRHYLPLHWEMVRPVRIKSISDAEARAREAELLNAKFSSQQWVVALDRSGAEFDSRTFASWLQKRLNDGNKSLAFLIGGPLGLDRSIVEKADQTISLSRLTFAHELAAVVLLEQIYRAFNLLHGGKYHK
ncbi:23S rRNA (pseudouridine(1915)-N(3))-methyltransferase RlmH [candidate division KSB1 bacterium]|nr:23S rRNA (pseudouridine(1915)-N(3))-methyltransferase RlmH [candidate division KSB1 bacterium]